MSVTAVGNRVRVGLAAPQPLTAELTEPAVERLHIEPGARLIASWKATATKRPAALTGPNTHSRPGWCIMPGR